MTKKKKIAFSLFVSKACCCCLEWIYSHTKLHLDPRVYSNEPKDITFPASLLTGALASFGLEGSKKRGEVI